MLGEAPGIPGRHCVQHLPHRFDQGLAGTSPGFPLLRLELDKCFFDEGIG